MHEEIAINQEDFEVSPPAKKRWLKKILIVIGIAIVAVVAFLVLNLFKVSVNPLGFGHLKGESDGRVNIMLLGVGDPGHSGEKLSDTNIIVSVNTKTHQTAIIGIPRDLRVKVPGYGSTKINNAHAQKGIEGAKGAYENSFGIPIHYYVRANFTGLKQVVDAVGGIDIDNPNNLSDPEYPCDKNQYRSCGFRLKAGHYHMDGATALKYVRCRKGTCGDDFGRAERQQQVMQAIRDRASSAGTLANPIALGRLVSAAGANIKTDLSVRNMARLADLTSKTTKSNVINVVFSLNPDGFLTSSGNSSDLIPEGGSFADIQHFVQNIFTLGPIWSEHPTVIIQNGTTTPGLGGRLEKKIDSDGYNINITAVANALKRDYATSQIIDYSAGKKSHTLSYFEGMLKVKSAPPTALVRYPPADIVIVLGSDYISSSGSSTDSSASQ